MEMIVAGVDIGGSHISASLVNISKQAIIPGTSDRKDINSQGSVDEIVSQWSEVIGNSFAGIPTLHNKRIGIAMPGPVDYETGTCYIKGQNKYESLYGHNIKELIADALGILPDNILLVNDAAAFLMGEMFIGAGKGYDKAIGLTLGTGLGSAIADGAVVTDADLWHHPFQDGKAEDYISASWLLKEAYNSTGINFPNVKAMAIAANDNDLLRVAFLRFGKQLGNFISQHLQKTHSELLILGGNISKAADLFLRSLEETLYHHQLQHVKIKKAAIGEDAALVGAASKWQQILNPSAIL